MKGDGLIIVTMQYKSFHIHFILFEKPGEIRLSLGLNIFVLINIIYTGIDLVHDPL